MSGLLALSWAARAHGGEPVYWNRDGSGCFPDARLPAAFDGEKGTGVRWKAALPNWSNSSPIVADTSKGPRVVLLSEPLDYSPMLLCFDADTGKELWRKELDAVLLLPPAEQDEARDLARKMSALCRLRKRLTVEVQVLYEKDKSGFVGKDVPAEAAPLLAQAKEAGFEYRGIAQSAGGYPNYFNPPLGGGAQKDFRKRLDALGLMESSWDYQGTWDGVAYPTPVCDGAHIWTVTLHNLYSCHDMDGNVVWQRRFPPTSVNDLSPEQKKELTGPDGKLRWPGGWPGAGGFSTSPVMAEGKLVSCAGRMARCLDAATGKVVWTQPMRGEIGQALGVPTFATVGGERFVVGVGNEGGGTCESAVYRLRDGQVVARIPGVTSSKSGVSGPIADGDLVINRPGHEENAALAANRLVKQGEIIEVQPVWTISKSAKREEAISLFRPAWCDGRLYNGGAVLDMREGKWIAARRAPVNPGYYGGGGIVVGPMFLSWNFYGDSRSSDKSATSSPDQARFVWHDPATGKPVGEGLLPINPADGKPVEFKREHACRNTWRWLGAATPFAYKDRLYIRSYDFLWCAGNKCPGKGR